jgi:hypothetical protein
MQELAGFRDVVLFTVHSVEQLPKLAPDIIARLAALAPLVTCLHFESVGWQLGRDGNGSSGDYATRHDYNRNLMAVLDEHATSGILHLDTVLPNIVGINPMNATSLVMWRSAN